MVFQGIKLADLKEEHLQRLVDDRVQERETIEYKSEMYGKSASEKREMLKDISSMANHRGGYLFIGIEEDGEGMPVSIVGIEKEKHTERITNCCLDNIDRRIIGLDVQDVPLSNGKVVTVVAIPESINSPHMVTHEGVNQFWKRHGRQKEKMTIDEIGEAFDRRMANLNRLDRFLFVRKSQLLERVGDQILMVISSAPALMRDEAIFDIHDSNLRAMIVNAPHFYCGHPYPTLNGLRADGSMPYHNNRSDDRYLEVFQNGYIEFGVLIERMIEGESYIASRGEILSVAHYMRLIQQIFESYLPMTPLVVSFSILNAKGLWLAATRNSREDRMVKWPEQHLELDKFYIDNIADESRLVAKAICDRLYQAFNREACDLI